MNTQDIELDYNKLPWMPARDISMERASIPNGQGDSENLRESAFQRWDMLATIFEGQRMLHQEYINIERNNGCVVVAPKDFGDIDSREVQMRLKDLMERTIEELMEAANCLKNKPWKNSFVHTDREHFYEELADAVHFFVELMETAGWGAEDMFKWYFKKHAVNVFRQESNY